MAATLSQDKIAGMHDADGRPQDRRALPRSRFDLLRDLLHRALRSAQRQGRSAYAAMGIYLVGGLGTAAVGILGFAVVASRVGLGSTQRWDEEVLAWIALHRVSWADTALLEVTLLGTGIVVGSVVCVSAMFLWLTSQRPAALLLLVTTAGGIVLNNLLKLGFGRPRPHVFHAGVHAVSSSFPSGHAMSATIVYGTVAYLAARLQQTRRARLTTLGVALFVILLICVSRLYLGVHYPSDVIAGVSVGLAWAAFCMAALEVMTRSPQRDAARDGDGLRGGVFGA